MKTVGCKSLGGSSPSLSARRRVLELLKRVSLGLKEMERAAYSLKSGLYNSGLGGVAEKVGRATDLMPNIVKDLEVVQVLFNEILTGFYDSAE